MIDTLETVTKALSDQTRIRILKLLETGELCVCQITETLGLSMPAISKALAILKEAELVRHRRDGKWAYYRLAEGEGDSYAQAQLALLKSQLLDDPTITADRQKCERVKTIPLSVICRPDRIRRTL